MAALHFLWVAVPGSQHLFDDDTVQHVAVHSKVAQIYRLEKKNWSHGYSVRCFGCRSRIDLVEVFHRPISDLYLFVVSHLYHAGRVQGRSDHSPCLSEDLLAHLVQDSVSLLDAPEEVDH